MREVGALTLAEPKYEYTGLQSLVNGLVRACMTVVVHLKCVPAVGWPEEGCICLAQ